MAGNALTTAAVDPAGEIADYLAAFDAALPPAPRRTRAEILDEIGDGLLAAADRHRERGAAPAAAVRAAITEFGPPDLVARAFAGELAAARARRLLAALLSTGPLVGVWWLLLLTPHRWPLRPAEVMAAIPVLPVVGVMVAVAAGVLAGTGRLADRLFVVSPRRAEVVARAAAIACLAIDGALLAQLVGIAVAAPAAHPPVFMAAAAVASLVRFRCMARAARRCPLSAAG